MTIAFDIDGVLTDFESFLMKYGKKYFSKKYGDDFVENINPNEYSFEKMFNVSEKDKVAFYTKYLFWYALRYPLRDGFSTLTKKLHNKGDRILFISSRALADKDNILGILMRKVVKMVLDKNDICYDEIFFCDDKYSSKEKLEICNQNHVQVIIEDSPENLTCLASSIPVICFNASYNKELEDVNRSYNVDEVYMNIEKIRNTNSQEWINPLDYAERKEKTPEELEEYFNKFRTVYENLPYDVDKMKKTEISYLKAVKNLKPVFDHFIPYQVMGGENIPENGPFIIAPNHRTMADPPVVMSAVASINPEAKLHLMAKSSFLDIPGISIFLKKIGVFFVDRNNKNSRKNAKSESMKIAAHGGNLIIFPEGTRNKTDMPLLEYNRGAFETAQAMQIPIIPCGISHINRKPVFVNFGKPIMINCTDDLEAVKKQVQNITLDLIEEPLKKQKIKSYCNKIK